MMNKYLKNLSKIEFVVTYACTGRCKHCSEGEHTSCGESIDPKIAADAVRKVAGQYGIKTVMTFGGEPLLYAHIVEYIMNVAREMKIPKRQVITNGYFSNDPNVVFDVARRLAQCGVNDLLLSVDAFHQERIPIDKVMVFASEALRFGIPIRLQPAWLISPTDDNPYNRETRKILERFLALGIVQGEGNVIFPEGNALKYLSEYFSGIASENPYAEDPYDVRCLSFEPNGDVLGSNVHTNDIMDIIKSYEPRG